MQFYDLETLILKFFNQPIYPTLNTFMLFLNFSAYIFLAILLLYYSKKGTGIFFWRGRRKKFIQLIINLTFGAAFVILLKFGIGRPRPPHDQFTPLIQKLDPSFPSLHVFISFLCLRFLPKEFPRWLKIIMMTYLVLAVPISALYLGIHYPSDLLGGALLGLIFPLIFTERVSQRVIEKAYIMKKKLKKLF